MTVEEELEPLDPPIQHLRIQANWNGMGTKIQVVIPYQHPETGKWIDMLLWTWAPHIDGPMDVEDLIDVVAKQIRRTDFSARYES